MEYLESLFFGGSVAHTLFILSAVIVLGIALGRLSFFGISFGIAGVLFAGLLFGHFEKAGLGIDIHILEFVREFGLILFVYTIGIQIGPAFFASFRTQGLKLNLMAIALVLMGTLVAAGIFFVTGLDVSAIAGVMSGAVTNTPGLGAAQQVISEVYPNITDLSGMGYAMTYPYGILGIIFTMLAVKCIFRIDINKEKELFKIEQDKAYNAPVDSTLLVTNQRIDGKSIGRLIELLEDDIVITGIVREGNAFVPTADTLIRVGDIIEVVCSRERLSDLLALTGDIGDFNSQNPEGNLSIKSVAVTNKAVMRKPLAELDMSGRFGVSVKRIERAGIELLPSGGMKLQFGDRILLVGSDESLAKVLPLLGDSAKNLNHPEIMPIFIGIIIGLLIGAIPISIPGLPKAVKLGIAGGPLLSAICLSRIGQIGSLSWYLPHSANLVLREIGITLFLACVGLKSGVYFLQTLTDGDGLMWMGIGIAITSIPLILMAFVARVVFKLNYLTLCGLLSGGSTDPPALAFAGRMTASDAPAVTYATVYAMTMFMRILCAQLLVIILSAF